MTSTGRDMLLFSLCVGLVFGVLGGLFGHLGDPTGEMYHALLGGLSGLALGTLLGSLWKLYRTPKMPTPGQKCRQCHAPATLFVTEARGGSVVGEVHLCEEHARLLFTPQQASASPLQPPRKSEGIVAAHALSGLAAGPRQASPARLAGEVEAEIVRVIISRVYAEQLILLRDVDGGRALPLTVNVYTADMVCLGLRKQAKAWPLTHDGWADCIAALGGKVREVVINDLKDQVYYARIRIEQGDRLAEVDIRPSDAVVLALTCGVPIMVAERLLA